MKRKWLAIALSMALAVGMLSGCGDNKKEPASTSEANTPETEEPAPETEEPEESVDLLEDGGGKVLNIYAWNDEFQQRFEGYYPDYKDGMVGDVKVNFIINPNEGSNYQD